MISLAIAVVAAMGIFIGFVLSSRLAKKKMESSESLSARIVSEAKKEAETIKKGQ